MSNPLPPLIRQELEQYFKARAEKVKREEVPVSQLERRVNGASAKLPKATKDRREADAVAVHAKKIEDLRVKNAAEQIVDDAAVELRIIGERAAEKKVGAEWEMVGEEDDDWEKVSRGEADEKQEGVAPSGVKMRSVKGGIQ